MGRAPLLPGNRPGPSIDVEGCRSTGMSRTLFRAWIHPQTTGEPCDTENRANSLKIEQMLMSSRPNHKTRADGNIARDPVSLVLVLWFASATFLDTAGS